MMQFNEDSDVRNKQIENTVLMCNKQAMESLHKNNYADAVRLLQKASQILTNLTPTYSVIKLKAVTLNNLGCVYKRGNDNAKALQYLTQALEYEGRLPDEYTNMAGTHLNLCAIKSHLTDHDSALNHALKAINIIQRNYKGQAEFTTTLIAGFHNAGVEYQYLGRRLEAQNFFRQGYELAMKKLGKSHLLTRNLESLLSIPRTVESEYSASPSRKKINTLQSENLENPGKRKIKHASNDWELKEDSVFKASGMFTEDTPVKKINVDTTPWPKFTEKKQWPVKVEPLKLAEATPKPFIKERDSVLSGSEGYRRPYEVAPFLEQKVPKKVIQKNPSDKAKPKNVHLHHHEKTPQPHEVFRISTKPQPHSTKSLKDSPSKTNYSAKTIESNGKQSDVSFCPAITAEKLSTLSSKLEGLQEKLDEFEKNYKKLNTLKEEDDDESIVSTISVVNRRKHQAALMIQKNFKRFTAQKRFKIMRDAAIKIQKVNRGITTRRKIHRETFNSEDFSQQFSKEPASEPIIIKTFEFSSQTDPIPKKNHGEIILVSKCNIRPVRKKRSLLQSIVMIQSHIRSFLARKKVQKKMKALIKMQRAVKNFRYRVIYLKVLSAIVFIQAVYRGYRARKYVKTILPKGVVARHLSIKRW